MKTLLRGIGLAIGCVGALLSAGTVAAAAPPYPADGFADAVTIDVADLPDESLTFPVTAATFQDGERLPCAPAGSTAPTVWYKFTYPMTDTGRVEVVTTGSKVTAYYLPTGSSGVGDLSAGYCRGTSSLLIPWFAGRTEYVQLAADPGVSTVTVRFSLVIASPPPNDNLANARWLTAGEQVSVDTRFATVETVGTTPKPYDIPDLSCTNRWARSTWYAFTATESGTAIIDPSTSTFGDVVLTGWSANPAYASRTGLHCSAGTSRLVIHVDAGSSYWIQAVDTATGNAGTLKLVWAMDRTPPSLTLPGDIVAEATGPAGAQVGYVVWAVDDVEAWVRVSCDRYPYSTFPIGTTRVSCSAEDSTGNRTEGSFSVTVVDTTAPLLHIPDDSTVEAEGPAGTEVSYSPEGWDAVDGTVGVSCEPSSGSILPIGTTTVRCSATDAAGNRATAIFDVTVRDTVAPVVSFSVHPPTYTLTDFIRITCSASDVVGIATSSCRDIAAYGWELGLGGHPYSSTATDAAGNQGSATTSFAVVATYRSASDLTRQWVTKVGVARDLVAILDGAAAAEARGNLAAESGKLAEFRAAVLAQAGKTITAARAQLLVTFSYGL